MKKTTKKLALQKSTIRVLHAPALSGVAGGALSYANTDCSGSCSTCFECSDWETLCPCTSVRTYCR